MSSVYKTVLAILAGGSVVVPLVVGLTSGWPTWLWCPLIFVLLALTAKVGIRYYEQDQREKLYDPQWAGQLEDAPGQHPVSDIWLDSAEVEYKFLFSGTVRWSSIDTVAGISHPYQRELAVREIRARARDITVTQQPGDYVAVQNDLAIALLTPVTVESGQSDQLRAWATNIALTIPEDSVDKLRELSGQRQKIKNWEHERAFECQVQDYLKRNVLTSPRNAVVWWLARHVDEVREAASLIEVLTRLVSTVVITDVSEQFFLDPATNFVNQLLPNPNDPQRVMLADSLVRLIVNYGIEHSCVKNLQELVEGDTVNDSILSQTPAPSGTAHSLYDIKSRNASGT